MNELLRQVEATIVDHQLLRQGEKVIVAVSGGPDSVALLHLLVTLSERYSWSLTAVHVNHQLRGEESEADERFVEDICRKWGITCRIRRVDVGLRLAEAGNNVQTAARAVRYEALQEEAEQTNAKTVVLGHHGDDQAETVMMRLIRGAAPGSLAGIRLVSAMNGLKLVRPLLRTTKKDIELYCVAAGLGYRLDSSNDSRKYFRNVVRLDILPYLITYNPGISDSLRRLAELSADEDEYMDKEAARLMEDGVMRRGKKVTAQRSLFIDAHIALQRRMIKIILNSLDSEGRFHDFHEIERMRDAISTELPTTTKLLCSHGVIFERMYNTLEWSFGASSQPHEPYEHSIGLECPGSMELKGTGMVLNWRQVSLNTEYGSGLDSRLYTVTFDAEALGSTVIVRSRRPGDRMELFGLTGSKKVKDIFIDGKLPSRLRDSWPIIAKASGEIIWIPGFRRSPYALVSDGTRRITVLECKSLKPS